MRVLVIGSGGREHAICWKVRQSPKVTALFCAPGNPGTEAVATTLAVKVDDIAGLLRAAKDHQIDLTIVGPELPLSLGIVDEFRKAGLRIFGPSKEAAKLEASKNFAKEVMVAAKVPTARYAVVDNTAAARSYLATHGVPVVLKADGLASGKGVFVCMSEEEAEHAVGALFEEFRCTRVVIEEFLSGVEVSFIAATDGKTIVPLASSHDYKRIFDDDGGPNTGGMGSVCPTPRFTEAQGAWVVEQVMRPVINEMARRGTPFSGFLYAGLMIDAAGKINVLEFNARLGDPETQSIMRRLESDLVPLLMDLADGKNPEPLRWTKEHALCLVAASAGYPAHPELGDEISGFEHLHVVPKAVVFHAGTAKNAAGKLITAGGRVLGITALGETPQKARELAYKAADLIQFRGRQLRRDIGK